MKNFILGYNKPTDENLTVYKTPEEADYNAEEWCIVSADTLQQAKDQYEETFLQLKKSNFEL